MSDKTVQFSFLNILRCLLFLYGVAFLCTALFDQSYLQSVFGSRRPLSALWRDIEAGQIVLVSLGLLSLFTFKYAKQWQLNENHFAIRIIVLCLTVIFPLMVLEISLRPFRAFYPLYSKTTVYVEDEDLIWKLNPGFDGVYDEARTRINSKGLRGPEIEYEKPGDTKRILFLGDSVIFGYKLNSYRETIPYLIQERLNEKHNLKVQCINSGVSGYSPWQEYIYLKKEGIKYDPDLVVIGFVLNDVTEKFALVRFGGKGLGKLSETYLSVIDTLAEDFALVFFMRKLSRRVVFGEDSSQMAHEMESLNVKSLFTKPDAPNIRKAWKLTLEHLDDIVLFCRERDIPFLLIVFPYQLQFDEEREPPIPQEIIGEYARNEGVTYIDLLPSLEEKMSNLDVEEYDVYIDSLHFSTLGCRIVADIVSDFLIDSEMLWRLLYETADERPNE